MFCQYNIIFTDNSIKYCSSRISIKKIFYATELHVMHKLTTTIRIIMIVEDLNPDVLTATTFNRISIK